LLALEDGTVFEGLACGARGEAAGEVVFNTSMSGYQEVLTDPSYAGQIVTMTMPHIGNYGVNGADMESRGVFSAGFVVREMCDKPSSWRSEESLPEFLARLGVVAIEGVDTRRLTKHIRDAGAMRAVISTLDLDTASLVAKAKESPGLVGRDLVAEVAIDELYRWGGEMPPGCEIPVDTGVLPVEPKYRVVALDSGIKYNILRRLAEANCEVVVVPPTTSAEKVLSHEPDGVFLANGPGDPAAVHYLYETLRELIGVKVLMAGEDFLDNGGKQSSEEIVPRFQKISIGTLCPALPGTTDAFFVLDYKPEWFLVLAAAPATWAFVLEPIGPNQTRLITRARGNPGNSFPKLPLNLVKFIHFIMERKQLLEIARRAETGALGVRSKVQAQSKVSLPVVRPEAAA
jgi:carbamoyl-phosphate synthase small subunit